MADHNGIRMADLALIAAVVLQTASGQIILKWQINKLPRLAEVGLGPFLLGCAGNPWIWGVSVCGLGAMVCWMLVLSRLPLNFAYPFTATTFIVVALASWAILGERLSLATIAGTVVIAAGIMLLGWGRA